MAQEGFKVKGVEEFASKVAELTDKGAKKLLRRVASSGASVMRKAVKDAAPVAPAAHWRRKGLKVEPGTLKRAVYAYFAREQSNAAQGSYFVSVRKGVRESSKNRDAYYWPWVEFGHRVVKRSSTITNSKGRKVSKVSISARRKGASGELVGRNEFFIKAMEANKQKALDAMIERLKKDFPTIENGG